MVIKNRSIAFLFLFIFLILLNSCDVLLPAKLNNERPDANELMEADIAFANMSRQVGMKKAFLEYISDEGVLLRDDQYPLTGANSIDFLSLVDDTGYSISWKPTKGYIAKSGDLGFTFGIYEVKVADTLIKGTYVHAWEKQADGNWKLLIDSSNQGVGEE